MILLICPDNTDHRKFVRTWVVEETKECEMENGFYTGDDDEVVDRNVINKLEVVCQKCGAMAKEMTADDVYEILKEGGRKCGKTLK